MKKTAFTELLAKPMTRKQFIIHLGMVFFIVSGFSSFLKTLSNPNPKPFEKGERVSNADLQKRSYGS